MELKLYHLIAKDKIAEQHILAKYSNCNSFGVTKALLISKNFINSYYLAIQCATGLKLYYAIAYQQEGQRCPKRRVAQEILTDRQTDKKWTNEQTEVHQFPNQPSYDDLTVKFEFDWTNNFLSKSPEMKMLTHRQTDRVTPISKAI